MKDYKLFKCPEVCEMCEKDEHVMHCIDELGDLIVRYSPDKKSFFIMGHADAGDLFWLERILNQAHNEVCKAISAEKEVK
jgi:hypothetical protein